MRALIAILTALKLLVTSLQAAEVNPQVKKLQEGLIELGSVSPQSTLAKAGGGTNPSVSASIRRAALSAVRSSRYSATICTPTGSPSSDLPAGIVVAGRYDRIGTPDQKI